MPTLTEAARATGEVDERTSMEELEWEPKEVAAAVEQLLDRIAAFLANDDPFIPSDLQSIAESRNPAMLFLKLDACLNERSLDTLLADCPTFLRYCEDLFGSRYTYLQTTNMLHQNTSEAKRSRYPLSEEALEAVCHFLRWPLGAQHQRPGGSSSSLPLVIPDDSDLVQEKDPVDIDLDMIAPLMKARRKRMDWEANKNPEPTVEIKIHPEEPPLVPTIPDSLSSVSKPESVPGAGSILMDLDSWSQAPNNKDLHEKTDSTNQCYEEPELEGHDWLRRWLKYKGLANSEDLALHDFRGQKIEAPRIQLIRAKNFLADEDIDHTIDFEEKIGALVLYCEHLMKIHNDEDWEQDLGEVLSMILTHCLYNQFRDGKQTLTLNFPALSKQSMRLPQKSGPRLILAEGIKPKPGPIGPPKPKKEIYFKPPVFEQVPQDSARDPYIYTVMSIRYTNQIEGWAQWAKEHAVKESWSHKERFSRKDPIMPLPKNFNGPIVMDLMDEEMKDTWDTLRKYQKLDQALRRAEQKAPRECIRELIKCLDEGLADRVWTGLQSLKTREVEWLEYISLPVLTAENIVNRFDADERVFAKRMCRLVESRHPTKGAFFGNTDAKPYQNCLEALNRVCDGPVDRIRFDMKSLDMAHSLMNLFDVIEMGESNNQSAIRVGQHRFHPEDAILWTNSARQGIGRTEVALPTHVLSWYEMCSEKQLVNNILVPSNFAQVKEKWRMNNIKFYRGLAYRFGLTIGKLEAQHKKYQLLLKISERQNANLDFLKVAIKSWVDVTSERSNSLLKNPSENHKPGATRYEDIVKKIDHQNRNFKKNRKNNDQIETERAYAELVRKGIILEMYENKNLLWATAERGFPRERGGYAPSSRREALWTFGHPANKPKAKRFFDLNRWPLHLQNERRQAGISASGPQDITEVEKRRPQRHRERIQDGPPVADDIKAKYGAYGDVSYKKTSRQRREEHPGRMFWKGDTRLQQKTILGNIRGQFESRKKTPWGEMAAMLLGKKRKRDDDDYLALPSPKFIPKSREPKKRRKPKPVENFQSKPRTRVKHVKLDVPMKRNELSQEASVEEQFETSQDMEISDADTDADGDNVLEESVKKAQRAEEIQRAKRAPQAIQDEIAGRVEQAQRTKLARLHERLNRMGNIKEIDETETEEGDESEELDEPDEVKKSYEAEQVDGNEEIKVFNSGVEEEKASAGVEDGEGEELKEVDSDDEVEEEMEFGELGKHNSEDVEAADQNEEEVDDKHEYNEFGNAEYKIKEDYYEEGDNSYDHGFEDWYASPNQSRAVKGGHFQWQRGADGVECGIDDAYEAAADGEVSPGQLEVDQAFMEFET